MEYTSKSLTVGDVIKTLPRNGYWGCAVVLSARGSIDGFDPLCHIGITPIIFQNDYSWSDVEGLPLSVLRIDRSVRTGQDAYVSRCETCIGIYATKIHPQLTIIGKVDPVSVFSGLLTFDVGDGSDGKWPLCGKVSASLGYEAVHAWRAVHDRSKWLSDVEAARKSHEALLAKLKEEERQKRSNRKKKRGN